MAEEPKNPEFTSEDLARYNELIEKGEETIDSSWEKFYEGTGFKVWRAPKEGSDGLYKYRSIGTIGCPAQQYFSFYRDLKYWKTWDENCEVLEVLEKPNEHTETIYWSVSWPFPLTNRDYVYQRFAKYYEEADLYMVRGYCVTHPKRPATSSRVRVVEYDCVCACKPAADGQTCTLFLDTWDDPQASLPNWVLSWVTSKAIPAFLGKLNNNAINYKPPK